MTEEASAPSDGPDLSPRALAGSARRRRSRWPMVTVVVLIAAVIIGLIWFLITNTSSFQEADDAVAKREQLGTERFQLLGSPLAATVSTRLDGQEATAFTVVFDNVKVDVVNLGTPAAQFQAGVPVVLEGHWVQGEAPIEDFPDGANDGYYFRSDRMLVKHDNDYSEDRVEDAEDRGAKYDPETGEPVNEDT